jgi:hypothetical protein
MYWIVRSIMLLSKENEDGALDLETYMLVDTMCHHQLQLPYMPSQVFIA